MMKLNDDLLSGDLLGRLARAGSLASFCCLDDDAQIIYDGLRAVRPDNVDVLVGLATMKINAHHPQEAIVILRDMALKLDPKHTTAKCFLGLALEDAGRHGESEQVLREVVDSGGDVPDCDRALALELLEQAHGYTYTGAGALQNSHAPIDSRTALS